MPIAAQLEGQNFGRWTVLSRDATARHFGSFRWLCQCECGTQKLVTTGSLRAGKSRSCGCFQRDSLRERNAQPKGHCAITHLINCYKHGAKKRGLEYALTRQQFEELVYSDCYYCGQPPQKRYIEPKKMGVAGYFDMNGVDRSDNSLGYLYENCVPCCKRCNRMKMEMSKDDFVNQCRIIANRFQPCKITRNKVFINNQLIC